ncbi:MAG: hypothetical protein H7Z13_10010 [Ferruginibacter sp.]|nr:hypothetical protein [Ferruginibacter sp.]
MKIATRYKQKFLVKLTMVLVPAQLVSAQQTSGSVANIITEASDQENFPIVI